MLVETMPYTSIIQAYLRAWGFVRRRDKGHESDGSLIHIVLVYNADKR